MTWKTAIAVQKCIWHVRWLLLAGVMIFNIVAYLNNFELRFILFINGTCFPIYFILWQIEGYAECKANCKLP